MQRLFLFDFDGTLSWIRHGWPTVMMNLLRDYLPILPNETLEVRETLLSQIVFGLSGRPTMVQMQEFASIAYQRGEKVPTSIELFNNYQLLLKSIINKRIENIRIGRVKSDKFIIPGAREFLNFLAGRGEICAVVSGTDEESVRSEAALLGLDVFFDGRIYGCKGNPAEYHKANVFANLIREVGSSGELMVAFGDGPVEISECKRIGGYAVAICTSEEKLRIKQCEPRKQSQLLAAGADIALPNFVDAVKLFDFLEKKT